MQPAASTRFYRGSDRIVGGVCSGIAAGLHVDVLWVRLAFVLLALAQGVGVVVYVVLLVVMPEDPEVKRQSGAWLSSLGEDIGRASARLWVWLGGKPAQPAQSSVESQAAGSGSAPAATNPNPQLVVGVVVLLAGLFLLANNTGLVNWSVLWPVFLIAAGALLLFRSVAVRR